MKALTAALHAVNFARLPPRVALFYARACWMAARRRDKFSLRAATKPRELRELLEVAQRRRNVVEIGTGSGWTTAALVLADPARSVITFDPRDRAHRDAYLRLLPAHARDRIALVMGHAEHPENGAGQPVDLVYLDGSHKRDPVIAAFETWRPRLAPGAVVAFHDWSNPAYPGVREAVDALALEGDGSGDLFVWRAPAQ